MSTIYVDITKKIFKKVDVRDKQLQEVNIAVVRVVSSLLDSQTTNTWFVIRIFM